MKPKPKSPVDPKLVLVDWTDSKGAADVWESRSGYETIEPALCTTVGFVFEDTRDYVTLVQTISEFQILGRISIPKRAIIKQRLLRN